MISREEVPDGVLSSEESLYVLAWHETKKFYMSKEMFKWHRDCSAKATLWTQRLRYVFELKKKETMTRKQTHTPRKAMSFSSTGIYSQVTKDKLRTFKTWVHPTRQQRKTNHVFLVAVCVVYGLRSRCVFDVFVIHTPRNFPRARYIAIISCWPLQSDIVPYKYTRSSKARTR